VNPPVVSRVVPSAGASGRWMRTVGIAALTVRGYSNGLLSARPAETQRNNHPKDHMMKVLIADKLSGKAISALEELGCEVISRPDLTAEDLPGALGDAEVLIVRSTKVSAVAIESAPSLSLIVRAGAGVNTIDLPAASGRGIHVANCPGKNTDAVAELTLGLLIACDRRIAPAWRDLLAGRWRKKEYGKSAGLKGRTLGILGLGAIGLAVAERASGLGMRVIAWSRSLTPQRAEELDIGFCATPLDLAGKSDAVSVHLAAAAETKHFVGRKFLAAMRDGAIFISCARGEVVDTAALKEAIQRKRLRVGLDVYENEPSGGEADFGDRELAELATCTPHIGASTDQAAEAIAEETVRIVASYVQTGKPVNTVNIQRKSPAKVDLVVRHYNRVGVLADVLRELKNEGINIEEMENTIFEGGKTACCALRLDAEPAADLLAKIDNEHIIKMSVKQASAG